jgi:hypothetical protein
MSEEQLRILRMLSEKKITVEQAEALLGALGEDREPIGAPAREAMEKLGRVIGSVVGDSNGIPWGLGHDAADAATEEVGPEGLELPEDAEMVLRVKGGNVSVRRVDGTRTAQFVTSGGARPKVSLAGQTCSVDVRPKGGNVEIMVPDLRGLTIRLMGGRAEVAGLTGTLRANVKGGDLDARDCHGPVSVKCMGGNASITGSLRALDVKCMGGAVRLGGVLIDSGKHAVKVLGGSLNLSFSEGSSVLVRTETLGGDVKTDLEPVSQEGGLAKKRAEYRIGSGEAYLDVKLFGGDVMITEAADALRATAETEKEGG